jgi:hypothetical protein
MSPEDCSEYQALNARLIATQQAQRHSLEESARHSDEAACHAHMARTIADEMAELSKRFRPVQPIVPARRDKAKLTVVET